MNAVPRGTLALGSSLALFACVGCAELHAQSIDEVRRSSIRSVYVVPEVEDRSGIANLFAADLKARGIDAFVGVDDRRAIAEARPDAVLFYQSRWWWDLTPYLLSLDAQLRDPTTNTVLAAAQSYRPSLQRVEPKKMVHEVTDAIFGERKRRD
jgi:hypothetical protein